MRNRTGPIRTKANGDENAAGRHAKQASISGAARASHSLTNVAALKQGFQRSALGEVTKTAVNRKVRLAFVSPFFQHASSVQLVLVQYQQRL